MSREQISALNLFHQNQTKSVILDTYIEGVLCQTRDQFPSKYTISSGKFRKIINQISDTSLKYSIDPPENMFVQNIMFYGNYRVLNGIDQTPAYNLQHMISVLFAKGIEYPKEFLDATYILVNGMLEISLLQESLPQFHSIIYLHPHHVQNDSLDFQ